MKKNNIRVGLFGIGLDTYWPQFDGLLDSLMGYQGEIKEKIADYKEKLINAVVDFKAKLERSKPPKQLIKAREAFLRKQKQKALAYKNS